VGYNRAKYLKYRKKQIAWSTAWNKAHPEKHKNSKAYMRNYMRQYRADYPEKVRAIVRVEQHRRNRELPTTTILNKHFRGAVLHHITPSVAIYIPAKLHRSISHNLKTGKGMNEINAKARTFI
jgi:hypothetical protein